MGSNQKVEPITPVSAREQWKKNKERDLGPVIVAINERLAKDPYGCRISWRDLPLNLDHQEQNLVRVTFYHADWDVESYDNQKEQDSGLWFKGQRQRLQN